MMMMVMGVAAGCAQTRTYDLSVENRSGRTVTLWLMKDGPPEEEGWQSPEQIAARARKMEDVHYDMATVSPGRTAETGKLKGKFKSGTNAILRVYDGSPSLSTILRDAKRDRVDHVLSPGKSKLAVIDRDGKLDVLKE
jgi:hypothetical protein